MAKHKLRKVFGSNVKYYRFLMKYTQEALAEKCDLSPRYISNIENGSGNISIDTIEKISNNLNVNSHLLFIETKHTLAKRVNMKSNNKEKE